MKKILLSLFMMAVIGFTAKVQAQCSVALSNVTVQIVSAGPIASSNPCNIVVNVEFDLEYNSGAKFVYFNSYLSADYAALAISNPLDFECANASTPARDAPDAGRLGTSISQPGKSFLDVGLDLSAGHGAVGVPVATTVLTIYEQDPTVELNTPANSGGFTVTRTFISGTKDHFIVSGLSLTINTACNSSIGVNTDLWASNANSSSAKAQCYVCGIAQFFNDPTVAGFKICSTPNRTYTLGINTVDPNLRDITYKIYLDVNDNGTIEIGTDELAFSSGTIQISAPGGVAPDGYSIGPVALPGIYSNTQPWSEYKYIVLIEGPTLSNSIAKQLTSPVCSPGLPVNITSFTAKRNLSNVILKWETNWEQNNNGFAIERNIDGSWQQIGFVASQAQGGNSSDLLSYQHIDANNAKGISQYRLRQVDFDNKSKYSEIRTVRGESQIGKIIVYPNPTFDGKVNVSFEDANVIRDISLIDMNGRIINQWKAFTSNQLSIGNLTPGLYTLRVVLPETGEQIVEKIVVNKR
jgi:Secretion system C-terminal sorting domain